MPNIIGEVQANQIEKDESWRRIVRSIRPEGMGMYGDFGRYVMGHAVHNFLAAKRHRAIPKESSGKRFDAKCARRWVLQRVKSLGWTEKILGEYDDLRHDDRMTDDEDKVERISKKYLWIALHELLGYLSDHYHMRPSWGGEPQTYEGAWQINQRNFDPSEEPLPSSKVFTNDEEKSQPLLNSPLEQWTYLEPYADPFSNRELLENRSAWVGARPADPIHLLTVRRANNPRHWFVLEGYWSWKEPRILRLRHGWDGRCEMWIHARAWLVKKQDTEGFIDRIRRLNFWGHGIQGVSLGDGWIGEYPHGAAFIEPRHWCEQPDAFTKGDKSLHVRATCDWDRSGGATVPSPQLCDVLQVRWSGQAATFRDPNGTDITTTAPLPNAGETFPCVVLEEHLRAGLTRAGLQIVWAIVGERHCWNGKTMVGDIETRFSGVYTLSKNGIGGGLTVVEVVKLPLQS